VTVGGDTFYLGFEGGYLGGCMYLSVYVRSFQWTY